MNTSFQKYRKGRSGAFSEEYHKLLGPTPWIVVKRLLRNDLPSGDGAGSLVAPEGSIASSSRSIPVTTDEFSEGDIATVFSQFGHVVDVRFVRNRRTGRFLGTAFVKFADYRSGIAAADEMNSNFEEKDVVVLSVGGKCSQAAGIVVERCEEVEVPALSDPSSETYAQWEQRVCRA